MRLLPLHSALTCSTLILLITLIPGAALAQQSPESRPFVVGNRLGLPVDPTSDDAFAPTSNHVKVYGAIYSAESCAYDAERDLIVVPSRGVGQSVQTNNAWVSFINHDGSVHTSRWIGLQNPGARASLDPPLVLNEPFGSEITNGRLYVADLDGGTGPDDPSIAVIRWFDMETGAPGGETRVEGAPWLNDIAVTSDGTVYATRTGDFGDTPDPNTFQVWQIEPNGASSVLIQGAPLFQPNGIALDPAGNLVVVNMGDPAVLTFSPAGELLRTEFAAQAGSDGLVIMPDGTKYVSSVWEGGVSRIRPGEPAELIAHNIPSAASMCYDAGANQLVIPMNPNNAIAIVPLD